jgi:hypothetical protein
VSATIQGKHVAFSVSVKDVRTVKSQTVLDFLNIFAVFIVFVSSLKQKNRNIFIWNIPNHNKALQIHH